MDIFFCDVCSSRVTDSHLRRGHGVRSEDVIVCGSCIEQGHGKDLLEHAKDQGRAIAAEPSLAGAGVIDQARDRARTMQDEEVQSESSATLLVVDRNQQPNAGEVKEAQPVQEEEVVASHPVAPAPKARRSGTSSIRRDGAGSGSGTVRPTAIFKAEPIDDDDDDDVENEELSAEEPSGVFDSLIDEQDDKRASAAMEPEPAQSDSEDLFSPADADDGATGDQSALDTPSGKVVTLGDEPEEPGLSTEDLVAQLGADDDAPEEAIPGPSTADLIAHLDATPEEAADEPAASSTDNGESTDGEEPIAPQVETLDVEDLAGGELPDAIDDGSQPEPAESPVAIDPAQIPDSGEFNVESGEAVFSEFKASETADIPEVEDSEAQADEPAESVAGDESEASAEDVSSTDSDDELGLDEPSDNDADNEPADSDADDEPADGDADDEPADGDADDEPADSDADDEPAGKLDGNASAEIEVDAAETSAMPGKFEAGDDDTKSNAVLEQIDEKVDLSSRKEVSADDGEDDLIESELTEDDFEESDDLPEIAADESGGADGTAIYTDEDKEAVKKAVAEAQADDDEDDAESASKSKKVSTASSRRKTSSRVGDSKKSTARGKSTRKSTRSSGKKPGGMPKWFIPGMIAIAVLWMGGLMVVKIIKNNRDNPTLETTTVGRMENMIRGTLADAKAALRSPTLEGLQAVERQFSELLEFRDGTFEPEMRNQSEKPWGESNFSTFYGNKNFFELNTLMKSVREKRYQLSQQH